MRGRIDWYSAEKGFGWVTTELGEQVYLSASGLRWPAGSLPSVGEAVELELIEGPAGKQAIQVAPATPRGGPSPLPGRRGRP